LIALPKETKLNLVLICGCGHTGSSILARIVGAHSAIHFVPEESGMFLANRFYKEDQYLGSYQAAARAQNKSAILEKTPRHVWHVDYIRRKYPGTRFILTTREGREVVASLYERTKDFAGSLTRYQDDSILTLRQLGLEDTLLVKYEDLVDYPADTAASICGFIGLSYEPEMLEYHRKPISWNLNNPYSFGAPNEHDLLRNQQVNSPLRKPERNASSRLPAEFREPLEAFFAEGAMGFRIMRDLGYAT
jgi:Uri superfamily endonuclease